MQNGTFNSNRFGTLPVAANRIQLKLLFLRNLSTRIGTLKIILSPDFHYFHVGPFEACELSFRILLGLFLASFFMSFFADDNIR